MKSLDTNVIIRFLVNDDKRQAEAVKSLFIKAENSGELFFISNPVILEILYVLDSVYGYERNQILTALQALLLMKILRFENPDVLQSLVESGGKIKIELEDLFIGIIAKESGCESTITFDKKAARSPLFQILE